MFCVIALSSTTDCSRPLGMTNHEIKDWQLAASSAKSRADDPQCAVKHARLHTSKGNSNPVKYNKMLIFLSSFYLLYKVIN